MKKVLLIGLAVLMVLGLTVGTVSALYVEVDGTGGDTGVDVNFSGFGMDISVRAWRDYQAYSGFTGSSGWLGYIGGNVQVEDVGNGLDTTVSAFGAGLTRIEFDFEGGQGYDNGNGQDVWAYADGTVATMDLTYDTSDNRGVLRRNEDQVPIVSAETFLFRTYHVGYGMASAGGLTDVSLEGLGYGELGKTKWGATAVIYGSGYNNNDVTIPSGEVYATGRGEFNHYVEGDDVVLDGFSFGSGFANTYIEFDNGLIGTFSSVAK